MHDERNILNLYMKILLILAFKLQGGHLTSQIFQQFERQYFPVYPIRLLHLVSKNLRYSRMHAKQVACPRKFSTRDAIVIS
ncbi:hypothetical protein WT27_25920 [Burkholderia territorii]|uniref:Uncharacterized protein n=1 Tax=Burkholderia territorii TaxID=1503055 RepID=A0A106DWB4_9BURK|nr:hypothetical protein WT27_25920 [Burkholderia territorii]KVX36591.1 hypothetical protein WT31_00310 [Burkholderia territorii]